MNITEQLGSRTYTRTNNGITAQRIYKCDWADREDTITMPSLGDGFPGYSNCLCQSIRINPISTDASGPQYAEVIFDYSTATETTPTSATVESMEIGAMSVTVPAGGNSYTNYTDPDTGSAYTERDMYKTIPQNVLTKSKVKTNFSSELSTILGLVGKLNNAIWESQAIGKWLFLGASARHTKQSDGTSQWDIDYRFQFNDQGWLYVLDPAGAWDTLVTPLYLSGDFSTLGL